LVFFCAVSPTRSHTPKPNTETLQTKRVGEEAEDLQELHQALTHQISPCVCASRNWAMHK
ncbi:hypothetical protein, partial [Escherichia coli]|uniref:hypothetical protein n=1 Tax=Escherichia coli TaxID=562 RepID=UPI001FF541D6